VARIRYAALRTFASMGSEATSLRTVAEAAGVSIGLVQHHFGNKATLVKAVDNHVLAVLGAMMADPLPSPPADPIAEVCRRATMLIVQEPVVVDYLGRSLIAGSEIGTVIFDGMVAIGKAQWNQLKKHHVARADLDDTWCALNPLMLVLGIMLLRGHIDRQLPEPFTTEAQQRRWEQAFTELIRAGQIQSGNRNGRSGG
jgi:AcrR family transcriptional regulator